MKVGRSGSRSSLGPGKVQVVRHFIPETPNGFSYQFSIFLTKSCVVSYLMTSIFSPLSI